MKRIIGSDEFNRSFLKPNNLKHKYSDGYNTYISDRDDKSLLARLDYLKQKIEADGCLVWGIGEGENEYYELDAIDIYFDRKQILTAILSDKTLQSIVNAFGINPFYESGKMKGDPIFNFKKPSERCFYEGLVIHKGEIRVDVEYIFNNGKARQDTMYVKPEKFIETYSPVKNNSRLSKIKALIRKTERNETRLMHEYSPNDYIDIAKSIDPDVRNISQNMGRL